MRLISDLIKQQTQTKLPHIKVGHFMTVNVEIHEKGKTRIQPFLGTCIKIKKPHSLSHSFTVRKKTLGIGIEKSFKYNSPLIRSIILHSRGRVRRAKLYYLRNRVGKAEKLRHINF